MATNKNYAGNLKSTQEALTKAGITNVKMLREVLAKAALTELSPVERALVDAAKNLGINSVEDLNRLQAEKAELVKVSKEQQTTITEKEAIIVELENSIKEIEAKSDKNNREQQAQIADLKKRIYSLRGQRGYLVNTIKGLRKDVETLQIVVLTKTLENVKLQKEIDEGYPTYKAEVAAVKGVSNKAQADLEVANKTVKKTKKAAIVGFALAVVLAASTVVASLGWVNQAKKTQAVENNYTSQISQMEDEYGKTITQLQGERDAAVSKLNEREQQMYEILDDTITSFGLTESMIIADQNVDIPTNITIFGDKYVIDLSDLGQAYYADNQDNVVTMEYFADLTDGMEFVNGYANEYIPMQMEELENEIADLTQELEDAKANAGNSSEYQAIIAQLNDRIAELEAQLEDLTETSEAAQEALKEEIADLTQQVTDLETKLEAAENAREAAEDARDQALAERDSLQDSYDALQKQYEEAVASGKLSETTAKALAEKLATVEDQLAQANNDLAQAQAELDQKDAALAELQGDYNELQSQLTEKETAIAELEAKVKELEAKIAQLEAALENSKVKEETPSDSNTNQGTNTPVADQNNPDGYQPDDNNDEYNKDNQPSNGR